MTGPAEIKALLPHRYPILLVDRVVEVFPGDRIITLKAVTLNEPWFRELPDDTANAGYDYPTALLIESWCQAAALLAGWDLPAEQMLDKVALFGAMSGIEVVEAVRPGDVVRNEVVLTKALGDTWIFAGSATVDGTPRLVVGSLMTALRPASVLVASLP